MSISQNFPEEGPTLNLNFAGSRTLDPRITFSRTTTGTYMDANGLIVTAPADAPRFDHRYVNGEIESLGLLVEESRSNLITYSADFNNWSKVRSYISGVNVISPDGTESANKIVEDNSLETHYVRKFPTVSADAVCAISVYVKSAERSQFAIYTYGSTGWDASLTAIYDLPTENITGTNAENCTINAVGNGWYRATYIATKNSTSGTANVDFYTALNGNVSYQGDNSSGIYLWGAQLEEGAFATSYIPRPDTSTATREPDKVSMEGDNFSDWFNTDEGTLHMRISSTQGPQSGYPRLLMLTPAGQNSQNNSLQFIHSNSSVGLGFAIWEGGSIRKGYGKNVTGPEDKENIVFAYKSDGDTSVYVDGNSLTNTISATYAQPVFGRMGIGAYPGGEGTTPRTTIESLVYYPTRLTNAQLQTLTK